ncbi:MAG: hypothetical protein ACJ77K_13830 [Bacteroidia bacterium]
MFKDFWKYSKAELIMDIVLILYSVFFSRFIYANAGLIYSSSPAAIYVCMILIAMFLPWYMGTVLARYRYTYGIIISFLPFLVMGLTIFMLCTILFSYNDSSFEYLGIIQKAKPLSFACVIMLLFYILRSFYIGFKSEKDMMKGNSFDVENEEYLRFFFLSFSLSGAFIFCMVWFARETGEASFRDTNSVPVIITALLIALGVAYLATKFLKHLQNYFPVLIITLLLCWSCFLETGFIYLMNLSIGHVDKDVLIVLLVFTGVIPFRFVLLFSPPLRGINLLTGIAAMICYFYFL